MYVTKCNVHYALCLTSLRYLIHSLQVEYDKEQGRNFKNHREREKRKKENNNKGIAHFERETLRRRIYYVKSF